MDAPRDRAVASAVIAAVTLVSGGLYAYFSRKQVKAPTTRPKDRKGKRYLSEDDVKKALDKSLVTLHKGKSEYVRRADSAFRRIEAARKKGDKKPTTSDLMRHLDNENKDLQNAMAASDAEVCKSIGCSAEMLEEGLNYWVTRSPSVLKLSQELMAMWPTFRASRDQLLKLWSTIITKQRKCAYAITKEAEKLGKVPGTKEFSIVCSSRISVEQNQIRQSEASKAGLTLLAMQCGMDILCRSDPSVNALMRSDVYRLKKLTDELGVKEDLLEQPKVFTVTPESFRKMPPQQQAQILAAVSPEDAAKLRGG